PAVDSIAARFSVRMLFMFGIAIFLVGTIAAALAPHFVIILLARVVQGFGTAVIMVFASSTGSSTVVGLLGFGLGPVVAGLVLVIATWQWAFCALVTMCVVVALGVGRRLPHT